MGLIWWAAVITGCVALAAGVAFALLWPHRNRPGALIPLANTSRLTTLPEYRHARRRNTIAVWSAIALLLVSFCGAVIATARPTGLPSLARRSEAAAPQDIMMCVGAPVTDATVSRTLQFFADSVRDFGTERIGLTSANRRVIPLTRDYQYAAAEFTAYAHEQRPNDAEPFVSPVSYTDYAPNVDDLLALCMTGFPAFTTTSTQPRSLVYVGPDTSAHGDAQIFSGNRLRDLAATGGVQVNAFIVGTGTGTGAGSVGSLVRDTGGRSYPADADVTAALRDIRSHPPQASTQSVTVEPTETPDIALLTALLLATIWSGWLAVRP